MSGDGVRLLGDVSEEQLIKVEFMHRAFFERRARKAYTMDVFTDDYLEHSWPRTSRT